MTGRRSAEDVEAAWRELFDETPLPQLRLSLPIGRGGAERRMRASEDRG